WMVAGTQTRPSLNAGSTYGAGGNVTVQVAGPITVYRDHPPSMDVSGATGGSITLLASDSLSYNGNISAAGRYAGGGVISAIASRDISLGYLQANGNTTGGDVMLFSRDGSVSVVSNSTTAIDVNG